MHKCFTAMQKCRRFLKLNVTATSCITFSKYFFRCPVCGKSWRAVTYLLMHEEVHCKLFDGSLSSNDSIYAIVQRLLLVTPVSHLISLCRLAQTELQLVVACR